MSLGDQAASNNFVILYASQTGNAERIAEEIADAAPSFELNPSLFCVSSVDRKFTLKDISCLVFIASTAGDGECPDSAIKFSRRLSRRLLPRDYLSHLHYALLALGDSSYRKFCQFGKALDNRLQVLGASRFYSTGYADDRTDYDESVYSWIHNLWPAVRVQLGLPPLLPSSNSPIPRINPNVNILNMTSDVAIGIHNGIENGNVLLPRPMSICDVSSFVRKLEQRSFNIPNFPELYLSVSFQDSALLSPESLGEGRWLVGADSSVVQAKIISAQRLTKNDNDVKKTLELTVQFQGDNVEFQPGDAFGFLCSNPSDEVSFLLQRLNIVDVADVPCEIGLLDTAPPGKRTPAHIPAVSTLKHILSSCVDLRAVPKKVLLRILAKYSSDERDRLSLEYLSSHEGLHLFKECIQKPLLGLLDLLEVFQSCCPPVERLLEHLPVLRPRFYSAASSPLVFDDRFRIVFNVIEMEMSEQQLKTKKKGLCTGWLDSITMNMQKSSDNAEEIESKLSHLSITHENSQVIGVEPNILIYKRVNKHFFLPEDPSVPIIMVGPGTGVAPFLGFLQHREQQMKTSSETTTFGETWLFYGCRYKEKDFLYRYDLERLKSSHVLTHLHVCFSRDESAVDSARHVQDNIIRHAVNLVRTLENGGVVYVCGDAKGMTRNVWNAFVEAFKTAKSCTEAEAKSYVQKLDREKRYITDVWG